MKKINLLLLALATFSVCLFVSCGGSDEDDGTSGTETPEKIIDTKPITMYVGKEHTIQGADTINSSNPFVAYGTKNVVHAWHVGEASLLVNGKATVPVTVLPKYTLYDGPICNWGCDVNYIKENQKQGTLEEKTVSGQYVCGYKDAGAASLLTYNFVDGKLKTILALVSTKYTTDYAKFLAERYYMFPEYEGKKYYFIGADNTDVDIATTVVYTEVYSVDYLLTAYMSMNEYKSSTRSSNIEQLMEEAKNLINEIKID